MAGGSFGWVTPGAKRPVLEFLREGAAVAADTDAALSEPLRDSEFGDAQVAAVRSLPLGRRKAAGQWSRSCAVWPRAGPTAGLWREEAALDECEALLARASRLARRAMC